MEPEGFGTADPFLEKKVQELRRLKTELSKLQLAYDELRNQKKAGKEDSSVQPLRPNTSLPRGSRSKVQKAEEHLGTETWSNPHSDDLKFLFSKYASLQNCLKPDALELSQFFRLLEDCQMLTPRLTRAKAQLLFFKSNKARSIDLWRFLEIVGEFARLKYPDEPRVDALRKYTLVVVVPNSKIEAEQAQLFAWRQDANDPKVRELHQSKRAETTQLFSTYRTLQREHANRILLPAFLSFCTDTKFIPDLITNPEAARLFRAAGQSDLFVESLSYEEFLTSCTMVAIHVFSRPEYAEKCPGVYECLATWYFWLEVNVGLATVEGPAKEKGLVVDPSGLALKI